MKKKSIMKSSRKDDADDAPELTQELLSQAVLMPPMTEFKSTKEYMAHFKRELAKKKSKAKKPKEVALALEPDVFRWFKSHSKDYEAGINAALRLYIMAHEHKL